MYNRTRCTLVTSVKSSALKRIVYLFQKWLLSQVKSTKKVLKKGTDNKNGLFFAEIEEYIHEK